jgi:hypothetical protein
MTIRAAILALVVGACVDAPVDDVALPNATTPESTETTSCSPDADFTADPQNCGRCGVVCASGVCEAGACADDVAGHVFAIGHSYQTSNPALDRVLANAALANASQPATVVTWRAAGTPRALASATHAALGRGARAANLRFRRVAATSVAEIPALLATANTLLLYAQPDATDAALIELGTTLGGALQDFTARGGIVVVLDAPGANAGTVQVLSAAGLLAPTDRAVEVGGMAYVADHADQSMSRVPLAFALDASVGYAPAGDGDVAIGERGHVVVVHRVVF